MRKVPQEKVLERLRFENPWWGGGGSAPEGARHLRQRQYFAAFAEEVGKSDLRRAVVLMGPRRVGKTVLIHQVIQDLIEGDNEPAAIVYVSVDHPLYNGLGLEELLGLCRRAGAVSPSFVFFDEIQYLKDWERHLKVLVDSYADIKFVASGSAAAALRLKSVESGAGRFTDFLLPPLTFQEYIDLSGLEEVEDIAVVNERFIDYLSFGGYPEMIVSPEARGDPRRYIRSDIIDKVLLRDLPSLYGIRDVQELYALFTTLAYNTAQEVRLESLSQSSGVAKNTIKRYIEYLESAFLIKLVHRIDHTGRRFKRANFFKVYLTNPSVWAALFSPVSDDDEAIGALVETAVFAHMFHTSFDISYARWEAGEIDLVVLDRRGKPGLAMDVKWSDRGPDHLKEFRHVARFCRRHGIEKAWVTTATRSASRDLEGVQISFMQAAIVCQSLVWDGQNRPRFLTD